MSDVLDDLTDDLNGGDGDGDVSRRRSLWWLLGLFALAALAAIFMIVFSESKHSTPSAHVPAGPALIPPTHSASSSPVGAASAPPTSASASSPSASASRSSSAPSAHGADGGMLNAVNALRAAHHLPPVVGSVSPDAVACAASQGSGPTCVPHYVYATVPTEDGAKAVANIMGFSPTWLLDPATTRVAIGWKQQGGEYAVALLKWP